MKSNEQSISKGTPASRWRSHCQKVAGGIAPLEGSAAQVRRAERFESQAISQVLCDFETIEVRASALRLLASLRDCSIRQVATFFEVETEVVVTALMLQPDSVVTVTVPAAMPIALVKAA